MHCIRKIKNSWRSWFNELLLIRSFVRFFFVLLSFQYYISHFIYIPSYVMIIWWMEYKIEKCEKEKKIQSSKPRVLDHKQIWKLDLAVGFVFACLNVYFYGKCVCVTPILNIRCVWPSTEWAFFCHLVFLFQIRRPHHHPKFKFNTIFNLTNVNYQQDIRI